MLTRLVKLALALYDIGAFLDRTAIRPNNPDGKGFRLKLHERNLQAPLSPYFLNLRVPENGGPLTQEIVDEIGRMFYGFARMDTLRFDHVVGIPRAGEPFAVAFSRAPSSGAPIPLLRMGKEGGASGRRVKGVFGEFSAGDSVLILDDLITQADTKVEAIREAQNVGLIPENLIVLVDREQGGVAELRRECPHTVVHVMLTVTQLLQIYTGELGGQPRMSAALREEIEAYRRENER